MQFQYLFIFFSLSLQSILATRSEAVNTEPELIELISEICSLLVIAPGHPTYGAFVLVRLLLKMVSDYPWRNETAGKGIVLTRILSLLATLDQQSFPYHVKGGFYLLDFFLFLIFVSLYIRYYFHYLYS